MYVPWEVFLVQLGIIQSHGVTRVLLRRSNWLPFQLDLSAIKPMNLFTRPVFYWHSRRCPVMRRIQYHLQEILVDSSRNGLRAVHVHKFVVWHGHRGPALFFYAPLAHWRA